MNKEIIDKYVNNDHLVLEGASEKPNNHCREMEQTEHNYLPGEHVLHQGEEAEVVDVYPKSIMIRIGRNTYKSVSPGELEPCAPDGGPVPGKDVRFG